MTPSNGVLTKSLVRVSKDDVLAAKIIRIVPTAFSDAASPALLEKQRALVANAINRSLCASLSERFAIVGANAPANLIVHAVVTQAAATDEVAAGASKVVSIVPAALGVPAVVPRIPLGLGSLTVEAEALDSAGRQQAAMLWARGADSFTTSAMVSKAGDAYDLASSFGEDLGRLLVAGSSPFSSPFEKPPSLPSLDKVGTSLGGKPKYAACEAFGRNPGLTGMISTRIGALELARNLLAQPATSRAAAKLAIGKDFIDFQTDPSRYRHWRLAVVGEVATLAMDVDEKCGPL